MKIKFKLSIIAFMLLMVCRSIALIELTGDHICHKQENYTETINSTSTEAVQKRTNFWCIERIRCSEMQPDTKEVVRSENITKSRTVKFCCPGYEELLKEGKKICVANTTIETSTTLMTPTNASLNASEPSTERNPYMNYTGEYGKEFNHYVKMGLNESNAQQSVNKLIEYEMKKISEEIAAGHYEPDGYVIVDYAGNEIEPLKHPQYVTDHHAVSHHEETVAMVTVSSLILGMCIFLILMVYIIRKQNSSRERDVEIIDPRFESKKSKLPPSKIIHEPLPIPPLRPSLRKHKSVTFDESIDEVDEFDRRRTRSLPDAYDVPRKPTSMMDLYAQSIKITPKDIATYAISQKSVFHTFPKKNVTRKQSLEHIYDEIPTPIEITAENRQKSDKIDDLTVTETKITQQLENHVYANQQATIENERTKD